MLKIVLQSKNKKVLDYYLYFLKKLIPTLNLNWYSSSALIPAKRHSISLIKSPHVFKKAKEHFEIHNYKAVITFSQLNNNRLFKFLILNKPKVIALSVFF